MSMQQIMRWGHDFLRIRGGIYLTSKPMGIIQVSIRQPINFQPPFLVLFINQLNSPKSQLDSYFLGERGVWVAALSGRDVSLDHMLSQGEPIRPLPSCGGGNHIPLTRRNFSLMHTHN